MPPIDWRREARKAVAEAALQLPNELALYMMGEMSKSQLFGWVRASLANQRMPKAAPKDLKTLKNLVPPPALFPNQTPDMAFLILKDEAIDHLISYLDQWTAPYRESILSEAEKEFKASGIDPKGTLTSEDAARIQEQMEEAGKTHDLYLIGALRRDLDSGYSRELLDFTHRVMDRFKAVMIPIVKQFGGPAAPSMGSRN